LAPGESNSVTRVNTDYRTIDAELTADLCDVVAPSDIVTVSGVVKAMPAADQPGKEIFKLPLQNYWQLNV
jgi:DNA replicative helicase MCM subunit Mcm2 (Cdc46/Mcm family)